MFDKIWARYIDNKTQIEWQGVLCIPINQTLKEYENIHDITIIEWA